MTSQTAVRQPIGAGQDLRYILFVRHTEALKNVKEAFGGNNSDDAVTVRGVEQIELISDVIARWRQGLDNNSATVIGSTSGRVSPCITALSRVVGAFVRSDARLEAIEKGEIAGWDERVVEEQLPDYYRQLELYRRGVLSSYDINHPGEKLLAFEHRVGEALTEIEKTTSSISIICAHRSTITAGLIRFARRFHGYPEKFFGFIDLPLGSLSLVRIGACGEVVLTGLSPVSFMETYAKWFNQKILRSESA